MSPHPDDAVLSCGQFLSSHPGVTVVTVFAGAPSSYPDPPSWWSTLCGFVAGDDITAARRAEDADALGVLGATPLWLDFLESQFTVDDSIPRSDEIAETLDSALRALDPTLVLLPFGLANPEHVVTHEAALAVRRRWVADAEPGDGAAWIAYEDIAYKQIPGLLAWRVSGLFRSALWPTPTAMPIDPSPERKREAMARYVSQVKGLDADWSLWPRLDAPTPEQYWRLEPPPSGWEGLIESMLTNPVTRGTDGPHRWRQYAPADRGLSSRPMTGAERKESVIWPAKRRSRCRASWSTAIARHPRLHRYELPWSQWGAPNADNIYARCVIDPDATYRIAGPRRGRTRGAVLTGAGRHAPRPERGVRRGGVE